MSNNMNIQEILKEDEKNKKKLSSTYRISENQQDKLNVIYKHYNIRGFAQFLDLMIENSYNGVLLDRENN